MADILSRGDETSYSSIDYALHNGAGDIENNVWTQEVNCFRAHESYFGVYFQSCKATRKISTSQ